MYVITDLQILIECILFCTIWAILKKIFSTDINYKLNSHNCIIYVLPTYSCTFENIIVILS